MSLIKRILARYKKLHSLSRLSIWLGGITMTVFYITAAVALIIAPHVNYANAMTVYRGCLEAAPASLAAGVCAGLLGDLMLFRHDRNGGNDENNP